jgi:hypothetical protein
MCAFLLPKPNVHTEGPSHTNQAGGGPENSRAKSVLAVTQDVFTGYISDLDSDDSDSFPTRDSGSVPVRKENGTKSADEDAEEWEDISEGVFRVNYPPAPKCCRHDIPVRVARKKRKLEVQDELEKALKMIEKVIASKKEVFKAGQNGLQAY